MGTSSLLHTGMSRRHRGNPAASIHVNQIYGIPVLMSGLGALNLLKSEEDMLDHHHKGTLEKLLRLLPCTPQCVTLFLSGSLPGSALLHHRQLSIFGMICRLPDNVLHKMAIHSLTTLKHSSRSWFLRIRNLCLQYSLPHPLVLLRTPLSKYSYKSFIKKKVLSYWEDSLRTTAMNNYTSLQYFHPQYMSLTVPHPMLTSAGSSPYCITMSRVQSIMLSGRYRTQELMSNWCHTQSKCCQAPSCSGLALTESLDHILATCSSLSDIRQKLRKYTEDYCRSSCHLTDLETLILDICQPDHPMFCQFLIDCSVLPQVIRLHQLHGNAIHDVLYRITRTWCFCIHRERLKILGRWSPSS